MERSHGRFLALVVVLAGAVPLSVIKRGDLELTVPDFASFLAFLALYRGPRPRYWRMLQSTMIGAAVIALVGALYGGTLRPLAACVYLFRWMPLVAGGIVIAGKYGCGWLIKRQAITSAFFSLLWLTPLLLANQQIRVERLVDGELNTLVNDNAFGLPFAGNGAVNAMATYLGLAVSIQIFCVLNSKGSTVLRSFLVVAVGVEVTGIFRSSSRTGLLLAIASLITAIGSVTTRNFGRKMLPIAVLSSVPIAPALLSWIGAQSTRFAISIRYIATGNVSQLLNGRTSISFRIYEIVRENPLSGNMFGAIAESALAGSAHNQYLSGFAKTGLLVGGLYAAVMVRMLISVTQISGPLLGFETGSDRIFKVVFVALGLFVFLTSEPLSVSITYGVLAPLIGALSPVARRPLQISPLGATERSA